MQFKSNKAFILASASPRRKELFSMLQIPFQIETANVDEQSTPFYSDVQYVEDVAKLKTTAIAKKFPNEVVIGADTIVAFEGRLLHKPTSTDEAIKHLQALSGKTHFVYTAVVIAQGEQQMSFVEKTAVTFRELSLPFIEAYVATKDPFDKAGGYGIQTIGTLLVEKIEGDYNNVVGLPLSKLTNYLLAENIISL